MSLALINGRIYTLDGKNSVAQALATEKDKILDVGTTATILALDNTFDQTVDLQGKTVLPSFFDSHTHLGQIALESLWVDLSQTRSTDEILELVKDRINKTPAGNWVVGVMYDDADWQEQGYLTKDVLDSLSTTHPIFLRRVCGHHGVANSPALELIPNDWDYVDRHTGILKEDVVLGFMKIVKPDISKRLEGTRNMMRKLHSLGITGVREVVNIQSISVYKQLDNENGLPLRVFGYIILEDLKEYLKEYPNGQLKGSNFNVIGLKLFLDGSLGARTAALKEPYSDDPENNGKLLHTDSELKSIFELARDLDLKLMIHAIGDRAIQQFIDVYKEIYKDQIPDNQKGHTLEHVEVIDDSLMAALKELGIWISAQPNFAGRWSVPGGLNEQRLGKQRLTKCNPFKSFLNNNIPIIFGSDCMPLNPLFGIKSAIYHPISEQRINPVQAIIAYVQRSYSILNLDSQLGSITQGNIADLMILSNDPFEIDVTGFDEIKILGTIMNGDLVFSDGL